MMFINLIIKAMGFLTFFKLSQRITLYSVINYCNLITFSL